MKRWWIAIGSATALSLLAVLVRLGVLNAFDLTFCQWARPDDVWGTAQLRADVVVQGLRPAVTASLLTAYTLAYCVGRRTFRPAIFVGCAGLATGALTLATKAAIARPDPHGSFANVGGGSFPSGHVTSVVICLGMAALVARQHPGWWIWIIPALGGALMGVSLLLEAAHWFTDVVGGGLLATTVLAGASAWSSWLHGPLRNDDGSVISGIDLLSSPGQRVPSGQKDRLAGEVRNSGISDCYDPAAESVPMLLGGQ
jgi:membrane-associated phospholipid phosphatase